MYYVVQYLIPSYARQVSYYYPSLSIKTSELRPNPPNSSAYEGARWLVPFTYYGVAQENIPVRSAFPAIFVGCECVCVGASQYGDSQSLLPKQMEAFIQCPQDKTCC